MCRNSRFTFFVQRILKAESIRRTSQVTNPLVPVLLFDDVTEKQRVTEFFLDPCPLPPGAGAATCLVRDVTQCGYSAGCRRLTSRSEQKKVEEQNPSIIVRVFAEFYQPFQVFHSKA